MSDKAKYRKSKFNLITWITFGILLIYVLSILIPIVWALLTSFKGRIEFLNNKIGLPEKWRFANFVTAFEYYKVPDPQGYDVYIEEMLLNSLLYSVGSSFAATFTMCITAYATARFDFKFSKVVFSTVLITMIVPIVGSLPSELQLMKRLGLYDTMWGLWISKANFLGMYYLIFYAAFKGMSKDITDAAYIDGSSNFAVLFKIAFPLIGSTFLTIMLIKFVEFWNDYTVTITYMPTIPTLAFGLYDFSMPYIQERNSVPVQMAACLMLIIPVLILFVSLHEKLMGNISIGGVKE